MNTLAGPAIVAGGYLLVGLVYIQASGALAAQWAGSVAEVHQIELLKGYGFIVVTAAALFGFGAWNARRLAAEREKLAAMQERLISLDRQVLAGLFAAGVAHDIKNILTIVHGSLVDIRDHARGAPQLLPHIDRLRGALDKVESLCRNLMAFIIEKACEKTDRADLRTLVEDTLKFVHVHPLVKRQRIAVIGGESVSLEVYADLVRNSICNLVINAAEAMPASGRIEVSYGHAKDRAHIEVHDSGPGIPPELRAKLFKPLVSKKEMGTGLGLFSVKAAAELHGGDVELVESRLGGAGFRLSLPMSPGGAAEPSAGLL